MDLSLTMDNVRINDPLFEGSAEHPVECEIVLPDYCPDMARILKTEATVNVLSRNLEGNRLTVDGNYNVRIIYLPENSSGIRCVTKSVPYSHGFDLRDSASNVYSRIKAGVAFTNCRPTGPRKAQIRASVRIAAKIWAVREESFVSDCENEKIEMLKRPVKVCSAVGDAERPFKVNDDVEIASGKAPAVSVIKTTAVPVLQDYKVISNKIIAKGEAVAKTLYSTDEDGEGGGRLETVEYSIPISQIIDLEGVDEDCACEVRFVMNDVNTEIKSNADGENKLLSVEMDISAQARAFREQEINTISDAFCTDYEMNLQSKPIMFENINSMAKYNEMVRLPVDGINMDIAEVADCSINPVINNVSMNGKSLVVDGNMEVSMIVYDNQRSPNSLEKIVPFSISEELANTSEMMRCDPDITVMSADCSMAEAGKMDIRVECTLEAAIYGITSDTVVVDMQVDDSQEKACPARKTLTLYYADKGEKIWDIAKKYNTPMSAVMNENALDSDVLEERSMLLIPKVRCRMK